MRIALFALIVGVATPALAQRMPPVLPFAPRHVDYVERSCSSGIEGRLELVRVMEKGQILKTTRRAPGMQPVRATRGDVAKIWRELDLAWFEQRSVPPQKTVYHGPYIMDGIDAR